MIRIAIIGSREYPNLREVSDYLDDLKNRFPGFEIITGGARGVDKTAIEYAKRNNVAYEIIRPLYPDKKIYYLFRNIEIITKSQQIVVFWDGKSKGTKFTMDYARSRGQTLFLKKHERQ